MRVGGCYRRCSSLPCPLLHPLLLLHTPIVRNELCVEYCCSRIAKTESCVASKLAASSTQELLTPAHALFNWVVHEAIPFSVVESPTFQAFVSSLNPSFVLPLATRWVLSSCALILVRCLLGGCRSTSSLTQLQVDILSDTANMADVFFGATAVEMHYEQQAALVAQGQLPSLHACLVAAKQQTTPSQFADPSLLEELRAELRAATPHRHPSGYRLVLAGAAARAAAAGIQPSLAGWQ
ncbi:hypothetical protein V8C86DRAFT_1750695 [Haematococcus lacustris]